MAWWDANWGYRRGVTVINPGGLLTGHAVRLSLRGDNFDFSKAKPDGSDIRILDDNQIAELVHWVQDWDSAGQSATVYVKLDSLASSGSATLWLYYGNVAAVSAADPSSTLAFWEDFTSGTLGDYTQSAGTWAIGNDSERGDVLDASVVNTEARFYKPGILDNYVSELWVKHLAESSGSDGALGLLVDMQDVSNYYKPSYRAGTGGGMGGELRVRRVLAGANTNINLRGVLPPPIDTWRREITIYKAATQKSTTSALTGLFALQGCATDGVSLFTTSSGTIARYNFSGVLQESSVSMPAGTTPKFGGMTHKDGYLYVTWIDQGVSPKRSRVLRFDASNLAAGFIEMVDLTNLVGGSTAINSIAFKDSYWIVGETYGGSFPSSGYDQRFFILDANWVPVKTLASPYRHDAGAQDATFKGNVMYVSQHDGWLTAFAWDPVNLDLVLVDAADSTHGWGGEGIEWDDLNARWYFMTSPHETNGTVSFGQINDTSDRRLIHYAAGGVGGLPASSGVTVADLTPFAQASIGVGAFRSGRFDDLAIRPYALEEPYAAVSESEEQVVLVTAGTPGDLASAVWAHTARNLSDVDGVADQSLREALLAYVAGKSELVDNGDGTRTLTYKKQDGVSSKLQITFNQSGEFVGTQVV